MNIPGQSSQFTVYRQNPLVLGIQSLLGLAVLVAVPIFGAWRFLWSFPILLPMIPLFANMKLLYWRGFDPFIWKSAENEQKGRFLFWNVFTIFLDWMMNAVPMAATAYIACRLASGSALPQMFVWLAFGLVVYPPRLHTHRDHTFASDYFASSQFLLSVGLAVASLFGAVTPFFVSMLGFALTLVMIPAETWRQRKRMKRDYEQMLDERKRGLERKKTWGSSWFPRKAAFRRSQRG